MVFLENMQRGRCQPLYDFHPLSGALIEVFYADRALATSFDLSGPGWIWWNCSRGLTPDGPPHGPFGTDFAAYRDAFCTRRQ